MQKHPELQVQPDKYIKGIPRFHRPKIIGYYGIENLRFAKKVEDQIVHYDLNVLYDQTVQKPFNMDVKLNRLLQFLIQNEAKLDLRLQNNLDDAVFLCRRGLLTRVACTPYERSNDWKIVVLLYKGNIFLCARDTEEMTYRKQNVTESEKRLTSWGHKFEQYMLSDHPTTDPNPNIPNDETDNFCLYFKRKLYNHTIVYGAEMDGIRCDKKPVTAPPVNDGSEAIIDYLTDKEFIELKTSKHLRNRKDKNNFSYYKSNKWWCQSFLTDVDTIVCGFRNENGIVEEIKTFLVKDIETKSEKYWKSRVCINFLNSFFTHIKRLLRRKIKQKYGDKAVNNLQALPLINFLLEWSPGWPKVHMNENYSHEDDPILTEQFLNVYGKAVK